MPSLGAHPRAWATMPDNEYGFTRCRIRLPLRGVTRSPLASDTCAWLLARVLRAIRRGMGAGRVSQQADPPGRAERAGRRHRHHRAHDRARPLRELGPDRGRGQPRRRGRHTGRRDGREAAARRTATRCCSAASATCRSRPRCAANLGYDPQKDLAPVTLVANQPFVVAVIPSLPVELDEGAASRSQRASPARSPTAPAAAARLRTWAPSCSS